MGRILAVHGIAQQFKGQETLLTDWKPALLDGLHLAQFTEPCEVDMAFYGDLFRRAGTLATAFPKRTPEQLSTYEGELLIAMWRQAALEDPSIMPPGTKTMLSVPDAVRRAFLALAHKPLAAEFVESTAILWFVNQVYRYFNEPVLRAEAQRRVASQVKEDTIVVVAHSLGSVVAYEALCAHPEWPVRTLVTIGSPLGIPNLVFDRLAPSPKSGVGCWPAGIKHWANISAKGDLVALERRLSKCFGDPLEDVAVDNGNDPHGIARYLTAQVTGEAIARGLR